MKIALAQGSVMPLQEESLGHYFKYLEKGSIVVFGEYVFDLFYTALRDTSMEVIAQLYEQKLQILKKLSSHHQVTAIVPLISVQKNKIYKQIVIFDPHGIQSYTQQILIDYKHWNERAFFDNPAPRRLQTPYIFQKDGMNIGVIFGFEAHFDELWLKMKQSDVDLVLVPTASAFGSKERWRALLLMRALCNGCMVVRVNRTGKAVDEDGLELSFYGESFIAAPDGEVIEKMGSKEGITYFETSLQEIHAMAGEWNFRKIQATPGALKSPRQSLAKPSQDKKMTKKSITKRKD